MVLPVARGSRRKKSFFCSTLGKSNCRLYMKITGIYIVINENQHIKYRLSCKRFEAGTRGRTMSPANKCFATFLFTMLDLENTAGQPDDLTWLAQVRKGFKSPTNFYIKILRCNGSADTVQTLCHTLSIRYYPKGMSFR